MLGVASATPSFFRRNAMTPSSDFCALLQARVTSGGNAFEIAETTLLRIIKTLERGALAEFATSARRGRA